MTSAKWHQGDRGGWTAAPGAVPPLPLRSCGYWEEQRSAVTATAWWPSLWLAAELGFPRLGSWLRGRTGGKARNASAFPQVTGLALNRSKIVRVFGFVHMTSAPGRIRTCAHGSGGRCSLP